MDFFEITQYIKGYSEKTFPDGDGVGIEQDLVDIQTCGADVPTGEGFATAFIYVVPVSIRHGFLL